MAGNWKLGLMKARRFVLGREIEKADWSSGFFDCNCSRLRGILIDFSEFMKNYIYPSKWLEEAFIFFKTSFLLSVRHKSLFSFYSFTCNYLQFSLPIVFSTLLCVCVQCVRSAINPEAVVSWLYLSHTWHIHLLTLWLLIKRSHYILRDFVPIFFLEFVLYLFFSIISCLIHVLAWVFILFSTCFTPVICVPMWHERRKRNRRTSLRTYSPDFIISPTRE